LSKPDTSWMSEGNCWGLGFEVMNPIGHGKGRKGPNHDPLKNPTSTEEKETAVAHKYCNGSEDKICPVKDKCLDYAVNTAQKFGVWGGINHIERMVLINKAGTSFYASQKGQF
jgi:hypothetical protein